MHEHYIPSSVTVTRVMSGLSEVELGHIVLANNSGGKLREMKTVFVDCECVALKLTFGKNYENWLNTYNQVAVVAMKFYGDMHQRPTRLTPLLTPVKTMQHS